jgi:hypothetical protein
LFFPFCRLDIFCLAISSFTFEDGFTLDYGTYELKDCNNMILKSLEEAQLKSTFLVKPEAKATQTFSHQNFNRPEVTSKDLKGSFQKQTPSLMFIVISHQSIDSHLCKKAMTKLRSTKFVNP